MTPLSLAAGGWLTPFISQALAFILAAVVLWVFVIPILKKVLGQRSDDVANSFRTAEDEAKAARSELETIKQKLTEVQKESQHRMDQALEEAKQARTQSLAEAQTRADTTLDKSLREIQIERDKAVLELRQTTATLTLEAADHLIRETMDEQTHVRIVEKYIEKLEKVDRS